ncbi:MAG: hypothetical protein K2G44_06700 [Clostridia bacterium]|nr:hypothetical protein [Clostridia bacterium]
MENEKKKECYACGNYKPYYTKGFCYFDKEKFGFCTKCKKIVNKHENCEYWRNIYHLKGLRKAICYKKLDEILSNLSEIKQILAEEAEEEKIPETVILNSSK